MEKKKSRKVIVCEMCHQEGMKPHPNDKKLCVPCASKYFDGIKPDLTHWFDGISATAKCNIIKQIMKKHFQDERARKDKEKTSKDSCRPTRKKTELRSSTLA